MTLLDFAGKVGTQMGKQKRSEKNGMVRPAAQADRPLPRWLVPVGAAALFFCLALLFDAGMDGTVTAKVLTLLLSLGVILLMVLKKTGSRIKERISLPFLAVSGYVLMCGISTFYAGAGKFAIKEFIVMLCGYGLFLLILTAFRPGETGVRTIASMIAPTLALFSLISIDFASLGLFSGLFQLLMKPFTSIYTTFTPMEPGTRINSIFQNPNSFAGIAALGILLSLFLVLTEERRGARAYSIVLLSVNSLAFLLAFSMGGTAMFGLSVLIYLIAAGKGKRLPAFVLMLETAVPTMLIAAVIFPRLGETGWTAVIPLLLIPVNALITILLDRFVGNRVVAFLEGHIRLSGIFIGALAGVGILYLAAGFLFTTGYSLSAGEMLKRSVYPKPGSYELAADAAGELNVMIESQNSAQTQLHTSTVLYQGTAAGAAFTVPEDSLVVYVYFTSPQGGRLDSAALNGAGGTVSVPLKYPLLPDFISNRLQGLRANENAIQRFVFFRDGIRVFVKSPVWGSGIGCFENSLFSVQDFYYTTKYVHNHYIQALAETGAIGFLLFAGSLVLLAVSLVRGRKKGNAFFPALCGCLTMIAGHSMVEVSFSSQVFQPLAFAVFGMILLNYGAPVGNRAGGKSFSEKAGTGFRIGIAAFYGVFAVLLAGNLFAKVIRSEKTFDSMERAAAIDFYEKNDSKLSYVVGSLNTDNAQIAAKAAQYADELRSEKSNAIANELVNYYFQKGSFDKAFETLRSGLEYTKSNPASWQRQFVNLELAFSQYNPSYSQLIEQKDVYLPKALEIVDWLKELNRTQMEQIALLPRNEALIGRLMRIKGLSDRQEIDRVLANQLFDLSCSADLDENGIPDEITAKSGEVSAGEAGEIRLSAGTVLSLETFHDLAGNYRISIRTDHPEAITEMTAAGQVLTVERNAEGVTAVAALEENTEVKSLEITVTVSGESTIRGFTVEKAE